MAPPQNTVQSPLIAITGPLARRYCLLNQIPISLFAVAFVLCVCRWFCNFEGNVFTDVCPQEWGGGLDIPCPRSQVPSGEGGYVQGKIYQRAGYTRGGTGIPEGVGIPEGGEYVYPLDIGSGIPPVLTPSSSHHNTYCWQAGGTHPTGMLSC